MSKYYLRVEGINLNNFVYDTADLSTVRGGSLMLLNSMDYLQKTKFSTRLEPISTGASTGLFSFEAVDNDQAENIRIDAEKALQRDLIDISPEGETKPYSLKHATFVVDIQPASGDFLFDTEALLAKNRWKQMQQPALAIPSLNTDNSLLGHCDFDLVRPGIKKQYTAEGTKNISESVNTRKLYGTQQKYNFYRQQTGLGNEIPEKFVTDLDKLTSDTRQGNLHHKMAVIYLDGNRFSSIRHSKCQTEIDLRKFDTEIKKYRRAMLATLLTSTMNDRRSWFTEDMHCRIETLLWGGDEIMWVVPAWLGWNTLSFFYSVSKKWIFNDVRLTHGAAIIFCHHNAPIPRIKDLAHKLADLAKDKSRDQNFFAYQVLESFDHIGRNLENYREEICPEGCNSQSLILNGEDMNEINIIMKKIKADDKFPKRQMYLIVKQLLSKPSEAQCVIDSLDAGIKEKISEIAPYFNRADVMWIHLQELWDYVGV